MGYGFGALNDYADRCFANAKAHGFHEKTPSLDRPEDTRHLLSWMMLITTEVAEAAEAIRKGDKENFAEELADICIRVFDSAAALGINLEQEIVNKMIRNEARPHMHGGKRA